MQLTALTMALPVAAYLMGSISTAIIVCKLMRLPDPRSLGSGNPGATNVLRTGGKLAAAITLLGDMLKGLIPVVLASRLELSPLIVGLTALAAVLGHVFPLFFHFEGGKGVATAFGAIFGISWLTGLLTVTTWLALSLVYRISSLAAIASLSILPLYIWITTKSLALTVCGAVIACIVIMRHHANIVRLVKRQEPKIGSRKKTEEDETA